MKILFVFIFLVTGMFGAQIDTKNHNFEYSDLYIKKMEYYENMLLFDNASETRVGCKVSGENTNKFCGDIGLIEDSHTIIQSSLANKIVDLPHKWTTGNGYSTYSVNIISNLEKTTIGNKSWLAYEAFRLWVYKDGVYELIAKTGQVGKNIHNSVAADSNDLYTYQNEKKPFKLIVEVSSFNRERGGIGEPYIGTPSEARKRFSTYLWKEWFISGFISLAGIYHIFVFLLHRRITSSLWFGLFCLGIAVRGVLTTRIPELLYDPALVFEYRMRLEYSTVVLPSLFFIYYIHHALFNAINRKVLNVITSYCCLMIVYNVLGHHYHFPRYLIFFQLAAIFAIIISIFYLVKYTFFTNKESVKVIARLLLITGLIFMGTVIWDILSTLELIPYRGQWTSVGLIVFIVGQTFIITLKSSLIYKENERITNNLKHEIDIATKKYKLEKEKAEDTLNELKMSEKKLLRLESDSHLSTLAAYMAHEINNPLNYITTGLSSISMTSDNLMNTINEVIPDNDEGREFKRDLDERWDKIFEQIKTVAHGSEKITHIIQEVRNITALDGLTIKEFDLRSLLIEEILYSHEKHSTIETPEIIINDVLYSDFFEKYNIQSNKSVIRRTFRTLLSEAYHFTSLELSRKSKIKINFSKSKLNDKSIYEITISNNGRTIKSENPESVFDSKLNRGHGTEIIGLPSIKAILSKVNGMILLTDRGEKSGWVTFTIYIPEFL